MVDDKITIGEFAKLEKLYLESCAIHYPNISQTKDEIKNLLNHKT